MTYTIRPVRPTDLAAVTEVEAICFPAAEAAAEESFKARIAAFPECFFVAEADGKIIGFINGCATDSKTIYDEMYENSACHRPDGAYQSIFGLDVIPDYRCQGIAVGEQLDVFRKLSWKIVIISFVVMASTYFGSAAISNIILLAKGLI